MKDRDDEVSIVKTTAYNKAGERCSSTRKSGVRIADKKGQYAPSKKGKLIARRRA